MMKRMRRTSLPIQVAILAAICASSCATTTTTTTRDFRRQAEKPQGFFERLTDAMTERECNVMRFTCPYGWGPAGEPCDCTDPKGVVLKGVTVK
jgi:hypothetical protein